MNEQADYSGQIFGDVNSRMRTLEEKQKILKSQILLLGQNLIEIKDKTNQKIVEMKKDVELLKQNMERANSFLESISSEFSKFAKKEDVEILAKQARMFNPFLNKKKQD